MVAVEATIIATALPTIVAELSGFHLYSWVFSVYLLSQAVLVPIYGRLGDRYGRKPVLTFGIVAFLIGSTLCGFANSMTTLIVFRAIQGIGGGAIGPMVLTLMSDICTPEERPRIQSYSGTIWGVSAVAGPLVGAVLLEHLHWAFIFWINIPFGIAALAILHLRLREDPKPRQHRLDYLAPVLLAVGLSALMIALVQWTKLDAVTLAVLLIGSPLVLAALFVYERRSPEPILPLDIWRMRTVAVGGLGALTLGALTMGVTAFLPFYVQTVGGGSALMGGLALGGMMLGWPMGGNIAGRMALRSSFRRMIIIGGCILIASCSVLVALTQYGAYVEIAICSLFIGIGVGCCNNNFMVATQSSVGYDKRASATSSSVFMRMVGQAMGAALFGGVLNAAIATQAPDAAGMIERLMEPALRSSIPAAELALVSGALADGLHYIFLLLVVFAVATLALGFQMPAGLNPLNSVGARGR